MFGFLRQGPQFYKKVLALAGPLVAQNLLNASLSLADNFMVGVLGEEALAAVALANTLFFIFLLICIGFQSGMSVLTSQYWGKQDMPMIRRITSMAFLVLIGFLILASTVILLFPREIMGILTPDVVLGDIGAEYVRVVTFSYPLMAVSMLVLGALRSMGNARIGMYINCSAMALNIFFNWVFIFGNLGAPAMGVTGAALGTLLARAVEMVLAVTYAHRNSYFQMRIRDYFRPGQGHWHKFFKYCMPVVLNETMWGLGFSATSIILGHMPNPAASLAAYSIAGTVERVFTSLNFGIGSATAIIVGNSVGEGTDRKKVHSQAMTMNTLAVLTGVVGMGLLLLFNATLMDSVVLPLFKATAETGAVLHSMILILSFFMPIKALNFSVLVGTLRAGGDVKFVVVVDTAIMYGLSIPVQAVLGLVLGVSPVWVFLVPSVEELLKLAASLPRALGHKWIHDVTLPETKGEPVAQEE